MKQPHEDVTGIDRSSDDLLSLDDRALAHRRALIAVAGHLRTAVGVGSPAPIVARMWERMMAPQVGDFVIETTRVIHLSPRLDDDSLIKGSGFLVEHRREWWTTDEEWERQQAEDPGAYGDERPVDEVWYVQYGPPPGAICRWANAGFIAVPLEPRMFNIPVGIRDDRGVTLTRSDLLADLADHGIQLRTT